MKNHLDGQGMPATVNCCPMQLESCCLWCTKWTTCVCENLQCMLLLVTKLGLCGLTGTGVPCLFSASNTALLCVSVRLRDSRHGELLQQHVQTARNFWNLCDMRQRNAQSFCGICRRVPIASAIWQEQKRRVRRFWRHRATCCDTHHHSVSIAL